MPRSCTCGACVALNVSAEPLCSTHLPKMEDWSYLNPKSTSRTTTQAPDFLSESGSGSGMFSGSQSFTVTGQTFTNITNNYANVPTVPSGNFSST
ncbi:hypothetical protein B0H19DRAFT_138113 [Mycena capillaripes]|nr:hypothetical protein B0H19DRAFT_138113 [Mycena capillaripes]